MSEPRIEELTIPEAVGAPGWDDFAALVDIVNATEAAAYGTTDAGTTAEQVLPAWRDPNEGRRFLVIRVDGRLGAYAALSWQLETPEVGTAMVRVRPELQGAGLGRALAERLELLAVSLGQNRLLAWAPSPPGAGDRLTPPTGAGSVPVGNREVRFLVARGWRLEQVERASRYPLPADPGALAALRRDAAARAEGYAVHTWIGPTPERFREGMAHLLQLMTTDAPSAGLEEPEETWDADRVAEYDARLDTAPGALLTTVAEHPSGRLAGFTRLAVPAEPTSVQQWDTIVGREDRGHRLGMLVKVVNLAELGARFPGHPSVVTWNAEQNRHMLAVNEAIGFETIGYEGAWRKDLGDPQPVPRDR